MKQTAELIGVHYDTLRQWRRKGMNRTTVERVCDELRLHPAMIWPEYADLLVAEHEAREEARLARKRKRDAAAKRRKYRRDAAYRKAQKERLAKWRAESKNALRVYNRVYYWKNVEKEREANRRNMRALRARRVSLQDVSVDKSTLTTTATSTSAAETLAEAA